MAGKGGLEQLFLLAQKAANIVLVAVVLIWLALRFGNGAALEGWVAQTAPDYPVVSNMGTAVWVTAVLFFLLITIFFLNRTVYKNRLNAEYSLKPSAPRPAQFVAYPLLHNDSKHLWGNLSALLLLAALAVVITPNLQAFLLASAVILLVQGVGIWWFGGKKTSHLGASGFVTGYFSFVVVYGLTLHSWQSLIAILAFVVYWQSILATLRNRQNVSVAGHFWGFISGILAAALLFYLS
ncbi:MAG: rhomboid family intramembrane serine protease [Chloroflexi bacterium]|jgi:membrane associated rhomboid family serine protease|nr:rhomboid family intramembrane serine protease [Chloroflexota bacterium]MBK6710685.1 rhomboid family intramembrane serine protease [Chloroflexota bacterium]MBK7179122.1 rhomboid family intramembrane serine protease [Chloroflexota bacterium]MBK7917393.1 rhomboid family intramembrane serine protease [Chloroflexota bacterium]MBK8933181.1 rhomboid family intramembrane serine protease [Chloroflexota bacterium]